MNYNIKELISKMTLEEKASLLSGKDFWSTKSVERLNIDSIILTDGPHGLRMQAVSSDNLNLQTSLKSTCFPTASSSACSFDPSILYEMGKSIAEECKAAGVAVILGPGINIKRSPLCGRNFEYFSEDPFLTGELAKAWVRGAEDNNIATSVKHFACNNQETLRLIIDAIVDERALREIYLSAFETVVKEACPSTVMCAYNKVNGEYASESKYFLNDILREEWGFKGFVVSDWGAVNDRVEALKAGLDLQMPSTGGYDDKKIIEAVEKGELKEDILDKAIERILKISLNVLNKKCFEFDKVSHHNTARKIAEASAVLLKNDEKILPLKKECSIAVLGEFAQNPRFQGNGSSLINAFEIDTAKKYFKEKEIKFDYEKGYDIESDKIDNSLIENAVNISKNKDAVIIFAGITSAYESEGFDRKHMRMPDNHNALIDAVSKVNKNIIVVLSLGSPVEMPWINKVKALINIYLSGEACISAALNIIFGFVNPSGKLAETFPLKLEDTPSFNYFPGGNKAVEYRESIFVGYRYYDKAKKEVLFPFGFGLSYTNFDFSNLSVDYDTVNLENFNVSFEITNTGGFDGAEVAQVYISSPENKIFKAEKELKGFEKVFIKSKEMKRVSIKMSERSFSFYNIETKSFEIETGTYTIHVGSSSRHLPLSKTIEIANKQFDSSVIKDYRINAKCYYDMTKTPLVIEDDAFKFILGRELKRINEKAKKPFNLNNNILDIIDIEIGKKFYEKTDKAMDKLFEGDMSDTKNMFKSMILETPFRTLPTMSGGIVKRDEIEYLIKRLNAD